MDKEQKELELKKLEIEKEKLKIEKAKVYESYLRDFLFLLLTVGAGIGTIAKIIQIPKIWWIYLLVVLGIVFLFSIAVFLNIWKRLRNVLKEIK